MSEEIKPRAFTDAKGRKWGVSITTPDIKRVRTLLGVDLWKLSDDSFRPFAELMADPVTFVDVVYVLCKPEADRLEISDEEFGRGFDGDVLESAKDAFQWALTDFFPPALRAAARGVFKKATQITGELEARIETELAKVTLDSVLKKSTGGSPVSSAATAPA